MHFILNSIIELLIPYSFTSVIISLEVFPRMLNLNGTFGLSGIKIGILYITPNGILKILSFSSKYSIFKFLKLLFLILFIFLIIELFIS